MQAFCRQIGYSLVGFIKKFLQPGHLFLSLISLDVLRFLGVSGVLVQFGLKAADFLLNCSVHMLLLCLEAAVVLLELDLVHPCRHG